MNRKWFFVGFIAVPGLIALLSLGGWQMKRLAWKEALLENISTNVLQIEIKNKKYSLKKIIELLNKNCDHVSLKSCNFIENSETFVFCIEIKNKSLLLKSLDTFRKISSNEVNISLYTSENIHE